MRHHIFYSRLSVSKSIFMLSWVIIFYCFCGGPLVVEAVGNCPVCPPLNPAWTHNNNHRDDSTTRTAFRSVQPLLHGSRSRRSLISESGAHNRKQVVSQFWREAASQWAEFYGRWACSQRTTNWTELNWSDLRPVDPVTRCVHWSRLVETRTIGAEIHIIAFAR